MIDRWWLREVGYEIYLRSFADADGDGVGDLAGITSRLDELAWLGVGVLWITPFLPSPMRDHGYDVSDYTGVDPTFGDLEAWRTLVADAASRDIRVLVDLVPNHTSSEHPWFVASRSSRDAPERDWYLWADPAADGGPPSNWLSHFGGPAWTLDEATQQYWCHLFLPEQPDLNWHSEQVREAFDEVLRFWLATGAAGFRIDVAHALTKDPSFPDLPPTPPERPRFMGRPFEELDHVHDLDQPDNLEVHRRWRSVADAEGGFLAGEIYLVDPERLRRYLDPDDGLHVGFWFPPLHIGWAAEEVTRVVHEATTLPPGKLAWVTGSHDRHRAASRYGGGAAGRRRAMTMAMLLWTLPGMPFLYQGEELGLENAVLAPEEMHDALARTSPELAHLSRDLARTPYPWSPGEGMGFTAPGVTPWLPFGGRTDADTWAVQRADEGSWLHAWRRLIAVWRSLPADLGDHAEVSLDDGVLTVTRGSLRCIAVLAGDARIVDGEVLFHRRPGFDGRLDVDEAVWLRVG